MTDTSHYTGSHKERFDAGGHGKGKDGRADQVKNTGYVGNYKGAGTYDKKHWILSIIQGTLIEISSSLHIHRYCFCAWVSPITSIVVIFNLVMHVY